MAPFFVPPKETSIHAEVARGLAKSQSESGAGIGQACAVHVQKHIVLMRELRQRLDFLRPVNGSYLGGLGD